MVAPVAGARAITFQESVGSRFLSSCVAPMVSCAPCSQNLASSSSQSIYSIYLPGARGRATNGRKSARWMRERAISGKQEPGILCGGFSLSRRNRIRWGTSIFSSAMNSDEVSAIGSDKASVDQADSSDASSATSPSTQQLDSTATNQVLNSASESSTNSNSSSENDPSRAASEQSEKPQSPSQPSPSAASPSPKKPSPGGQKQQPLWRFLGSGGFKGPDWRAAIFRLSQLALLVAAFDGFRFVQRRFISPSPVRLSRHYPELLSLNPDLSPSSVAEAVSKGNLRPSLRVQCTLPVPFSKFLQCLKDGEVRSVLLDGDRLSFTLRSTASLRGALPESDLGEYGEGAGASVAVMSNNLRRLQSMLSNAGLLEPTQPSRQAVAAQGKAQANQGRKKDGGKASTTVSSTADSPVATQREGYSRIEVHLTTVRPLDFPLPYAEMTSRGVAFGVKDRGAGLRAINSAGVLLLYAGVVAAIISRLPLRPGIMSLRKANRTKGARSNGSSPPVTFADVAGVDEAKEELQEVVEFLRDPERFRKLGARPPRGVMLVGRPGTGKTMLAKAVAGEADVPFFNFSGSEFVELYVGLGAARVRELFANAKKEAPCIVFIDEIDAVAKQREGRARGGANDEREQTLNQLLTEMDGFDTNTSVIVLAATNRLDVLDSALRRPGRFDRIVEVGTPDRQGRMEILKVHMERGGLPLADDVDVKEIATVSAGSTGADLANIVNEAALLAARAHRSKVEREDFMNAVFRAIGGIEKKRSILGPREKEVVAKHEVGHALCGAALSLLLPNHPTVQKISIMPRSNGALGFAYIPQKDEDRVLRFVDEFRASIVTLLGGRAAETVCFSGRISTGAVDDIRRATEECYRSIAEYGLSSTVGPVSLRVLTGGGGDGADFVVSGGDQSKVTEMVQHEVRSLLMEANEVASLVVRKNETLLDRIAALLIEKETLEGSELGDLLAQVSVPEELSRFISADIIPS